MEEVGRRLAFFPWDKTDKLLVAVTPDEAATSLIEFVETFGIKSTGEYWAPRGPR